MNPLVLREFSSQGLAPGLLVVALAFAGLPAHAADAPDLSPVWQARLQFSSVAASSQESVPRLGSSRLLSANLLGDYYLTGSGSTSLRGGLRATTGMLLGPLSLTQSSAGLALGGASHLALGQRAVSLAGPDALEASSALSYVGLGYSAQWSGSGLSFSADLGLVSGVSGLSGLPGVGATGGPRLSRGSAQVLDDALRDLRFRPLLQLGLSYSY